MLEELHYFRGIDQWADRKQAAILGRPFGTYWSEVPTREPGPLSRGLLTKEIQVAIVAVFQAPSLTQAKYEESVRQLTGGRPRMEKPSDWPVEGLLAHVAGQGPNGFRVVDVWQSEETFRRFGETVMPILQAVGVQGEPEIYPAHTFVTG